MNTELALKVNKFIHEQCIDGVPHDIGWNVMKLIEAEMPVNFISSNPMLKEGACKCFEPVKMIDTAGENRCGWCERKIEASPLL